MCLWTSTPALRFGSEFLKCTGETQETSIPLAVILNQEDTLNVPQDLPHHNPALLRPVVQPILHPHLVEGVEAMVMDQGLVMGTDMVLDMTMDMIMDTDMDMSMDMVLDMTMDTIMDTDMIMDMITGMGTAIMDMDIMVITDMDMVITDMNMVITDMDMVITDMDMVNMATGTGMVTCMAIVIRKAGSVMGPPAAPAAATLTR
ncbi:uncharacterized protein LOC115587874 isoform X2 [Sparus aurata]|uniref:uncharacterized protein LOC115587874 isoform X2 n=1 Tax=Sparus aurata TaxID=8175 RepID=UPI0011C0E0C8|nr:uncharacterized protein LOC115587874 isoform X2 [Sparus aurata]